MNPSSSQINKDEHLLKEVIIIVAFLQNATIEYSSESVCVFPCFCTITKKIIDLAT